MLTQNLNTTIKSLISLQQIFFFSIDIILNILVLWIRHKLEYVVGNSTKK